MNIKNFSVTLGLVFTAIVLVGLSLTGCSVQPDSTPAQHASAASKPSATPTPSNVHSFGDIATYKDGISISVSAPAAFTPGLGAAATAGVPAVVFTVVITNGSKQQFTPESYLLMNSAGQKADSIVDVGNTLGSIGDPSVAVLLPGQTVTWLAGFNVKDPTDLTLQAQPGYDYSPSIFTTSK